MSVPGSSVPALSVLIVDDEAPARTRLERLVAELEGFCVAGSCATGLEALEHVKRRCPAVVLLDVRMPGMSGLEAAGHLAALAAPPAVVFTTAYDQYALEAFESRAVGYLLKPVRRERLKAALEHAGRLSRSVLAELRETQAPAARRAYLSARRGDEVRLIAIEDVVLFRAEQKYVVVEHSGGTDLIEESLKQLADELAGEFARIHRSLLVAVAAIEALEKTADSSYRVRLRGSAEVLPVSRRQVAELKARMQG